MLDSSPAPNADAGAPLPDLPPAALPITCPICKGAAPRRTPNQVTCGKAECSRKWANRNRRSFQATAHARACAVCGVEYAPKSPIQRICRQASDDGKLTPCAVIAQRIRWYRAALEPSVAARYGMTVATVQVRLDEWLAKTRDPAAFSEGRPSPRRRRAVVSLVGAEILRMTEDGDVVYAHPEGGEVIASTCEVCGDPFAGRPGACSKLACTAARRKSRNKTWCTTNKTRHVAKIVAARKRKGTVPEVLPPAAPSSPELPEVLPDPKAPAPAPSDPWALPSPRCDAVHLPAHVVPIVLSPPRALTLHAMNPLHGSISAALGRGHARLSEWAIRFVDRSTSPSSVVVAFARAEDAETLRARPWTLRLGRAAHTVTLGSWIARMKPPPPIAPGRYRVRLDTVTPVVIKHSVRVDGRRDQSRAVHHTRPTAQNFVASLACTLAPRIGLTLAREDVLVELVEARTEPSRDVLRGGVGGIRMHAAGWEGQVVLDVNAPALWLLECAARGMGLGGRVAFGFGQVQITRLPDGARLDSAPTPSPPVVVIRPPARPVAVRREVVEVFHAAARAPARRVVAANGHAARGEPVAAVEPESEVTLLPQPEEMPEVTDHAVARYAERVRRLSRVPASWTERLRLMDELRAVVALSFPHEPVRHRSPEHRVEDPWQWVGPRIGGRRAARLRLIVGRSTEPGPLRGKMVVATVLPLFDRASKEIQDSLSIGC